MITVNVIGFAGGLDGVKDMLPQLTKFREGLLFFLGTFAFLFSASQIMFEVRKGEKVSNRD
jgi:hypothetical protein